MSTFTFDSKVTSDSLISNVELPNLVNISQTAADLLPVEIFTSADLFLVTFGVLPYPVTQYHNITIIQSIRQKHSHLKTFFQIFLHENAFLTY